MLIGGTQTTINTPSTTGEMITKHINCGHHDQCSSGTSSTQSDPMQLPQHGYGVKHNSSQHAYPQYPPGKFFLFSYIVILGDAFDG